jgi:hypothetical protein
MKKTFYNFWPLRPGNNFHKLLLTMKIIAFIWSWIDIAPLRAGTLSPDDQQQIRSGNYY